MAPGQNLHRQYSILRITGENSCTLEYAATDYRAHQSVRILEFFPAEIAVRQAGAAVVSPKSKACGSAFFLACEAFLFQYNALTQAKGNPNIVTVYETFFENGTAYAVTQQPEGLCLSDYLLSQNRLLLPGETAELMRALADGLLVVHSLSILHHNISPETILLCTDHTVKLDYFGAGDATIRLGRQPDNDRPAEDIRALGAALRKAFSPDLPIEQMQPPILSDIFSRMLATDPRMQFDSIFDFRHAVSELNIPPLRHGVTGELVRRSREAILSQTLLTASDGARLSQSPWPSESFVWTDKPDAPEATPTQKNGRSRRNFQILAAYGLMILGALILALILKNVL
jgi:serine/threonine protein kinase